MYHYLTPVVLLLSLLKGVGVGLMKRRGVCVCVVCTVCVKAQGGGGGESITLSYILIDCGYRIFILL